MFKRFHHKPRKPDYIISVARGLRKNATPAEKLLWSYLRGRRLAGLKFCRQVPFGRYIMDFYCSEFRLCIEIDGTSHNGRKEYDSVREEYLNSAGIRILHFTNQEALQDTEVVLQRIVGSRK